MFIDAIDVVFDSTIPYDLRFFQSLNRIVQAEPWLTRDKAMIDQLKSIGIEKGKTFNPDAMTQEIAQGSRRARRMPGSSARIRKRPSPRRSMKGPTGPCRPRTR